VHTGFWWGNLKERVYLEVSGVDGKLILNCISQKCDGGHGLDRPDTKQGRWRALVDEGRNLPVTKKKKEKNLLTS